MKKPSFITKVAVGGLTLGLAASFLPGALATDDYKPNGLSSETAAASCWEIKQNDPSAPSGTYWLYTSQMDAPAQFYCDQETDGGGWVMIGRGREGWSEEYYGRGKPSDIYTNPDGLKAFKPAQLSSETVEQLIGGVRVDSLEDGVRFRRAMDTSGSSWQNVYAKRANTERWSWALRATAHWRDIRFDNSGKTSSASQALSIGQIGELGSNYNSLKFTTSKDYKWNNGFAYGWGVWGNPNSDSYLWSPRLGVAPMGFTQVYLRPRLTQQDLQLPQIGDAGLAAQQKKELPNSYSATMRWRTSEESGTGVVSELNTRVQAITQVGDTVFTGGDFKNVVSASGETVNQAYLAGYNVNTAELVRSFTPTFNGQIKALEALPNNLLAVGGEFTEVNGQPANGFVILNPVTGETDTSLGWDVNNRLSGGVPVVKTIQVAGDYVYIGGAFTHVKGANRSNYAYSRNAARFKLSDKTVDASWTPATNGTVNGISAGADGVAMAGYFTKVNGEDSWKLAYLDPTSGRLAKNWDWKLSYPKTTNRAGFQFDVQDAGDSVWTAGAEHLIAQYSKSDLSRISSSITRTGGDFQDLHLDSKTNVIYGSCHCGDWIYEGGDAYDTPWRTSTDIQRIRLVGAFDAQSGQYYPEFAPELAGAKGYGIWESFVDSTGVLWVGGDITRSRGAGGTQATVGFARFTPRDVTPAAAPYNLSVTSDGVKDQLSWVKGTAGNTDFQVLRNNRVIATVTEGTSYTVDHTDGVRYFVRSVDSAGNYSATTPVATATVTPVEPEPTAEPTVQPEPTAEPTAEPSVQPSEDPTSQPPVDPVVPDEPVEPVDPEDPIEPEEPVTPTDVSVVSSGDSWKVAFELTDPYDTSWRQTDYAYNTSRQWFNGRTSIGWGERSILTPVDFPFYRKPMTMYLRKEFELSPQGNQQLVLTTYADDGIAVYFNGQEVHRENLPAVAYPSTAALSRVSYSAGRAQPITITVPASQLKQGKNAIAVEVHTYNRLFGAATFDMDATLVIR